MTTGIIWPTFRGLATWKTNDSDIPVEIIGCAGVMGDEVYYNTTNGAGAIPASQIEIPGQKVEFKLSTSNRFEDKVVKPAELTKLRTRADGYKKQGKIYKKTGKVYETNDLDRSPLGWGWQSRQLNMLKLWQHISGGNAFCVAKLKSDNRKYANFEEAQIIGVDLDRGAAIEMLEQHPFISLHAGLLYASPSSRPELPKTRVIFLLDQPVKDPKKYKEYVTKILYHFANMGAWGTWGDNSCSDSVRLFFGSTKAALSENYRLTDNTLPISVIEALPDGRVKTPEYYAKQIIQNIEKAIADAADGDKHTTLRNMAIWAGGYVQTGILRESHAEQILQDAISKRADVKDLNLAYQTIKDGIEYGKGQPITFEELEKKRLDWLRSQGIVIQPTYTGSSTGGSEEEKKGPAEALEDLKGLGYEFRRNLMDDSLEVNGQRIDTYIEKTIKTQMRSIGYTTNDMSMIEDVMFTEASVNQHNPLIEMLDALEWDKQPHIDKFCDYFSDNGATVDDSCPIFRQWFTAWIKGAVAKVYYQAQNPILVLDGPQDLGKSFVCRWIASPFGGDRFFVEGAINPDNKDDQLRSLRALVWEVDELGGTTLRRDVEALKGFLTRKVVSQRPPFGKHDVVKPVVASFIGTLNNTSGYLNDPSGNRRYMSVTLTAIRRGYSIEIDPAQIWAEAVARVKGGESWELDETQKALRDEINKDYEVIDPIENYLDKYFDIDPNAAEFTATADLINNLQELGVRGASRSIAMGIASVLKKKGLEKDKPAKNWGYYGIMINAEGYAAIEAKKRQETN